MEDDIRLVDLIDVDILQRVQDMFFTMTGMAAQCNDAHGQPITKGSGYTDFCKDNIRCSAKGKMLCGQCSKYAAQKAIEQGRSTPYICHAGIFDFSAPVIVDGKYLGSFSGGQVLVDPLNEESLKETAEDLKLDPDRLIDASYSIPIVSRTDIEKAAEYIYVQASILSDMAYGKYISRKASQELRASSNMKSDFLANMSHEIRTPMNAVIGMAEMALREEMTPAAKDYIGQIKSSGKALLNIINDILDYSKIESGKMELSCVEYEPMKLINDVASIVLTRLTDKPVELLLDIDPGIPRTLLGDDLRIRQILINLANNATKFTKKGHVLIKTRYKLVAEDTISLIVSVKDTGIGIRKDDLDKLFNSFQQVDSKRNRNVEGTGLGLAITKNLVSLMGGEIHVESEYEVGSTFTFEIPQKAVDMTPSIELKEPEKYALAGCFVREDIAEDFVSDANKLKVYADDISTSTNPEESIKAWSKLHKVKETIIVVDEDTMEKQFVNNLKRYLDMDHKAILLAEPFSDVKKWQGMNNLTIIRKPFSVLSLANYLEPDSCRFGSAEKSESEFSFVAPDAKVLVVDDNVINLTVAEGLLEPLKMDIHTAKSGMEALKKIEETHYDIIFMDHMMPEMDGVETTRIIRRLHPECADIPIIALTANAVSGTKEMFLSEGMNDYIAKPIEVRLLIDKVHQWLSPEKIKTVTQTEAEANATSDTPPIPDKIGELDIKGALSLVGSEKLFWKVLKNYYRVIENKSALIMQYYEAHDWTNYIVEVHALKSASKQIGANALSKMAAELEAAGNAKDVATVEKRTVEMVEIYRSLIPVLEPFCKDEDSDEEKPEITSDVLEKLFDRMRTAIDDLDSVEMENIIGEMEKYSYPEDKKEMFANLKNAVSDIDVDACEDIVNAWTL